MSKLKINPDLFLGSQELNRWQKFLDDDGFRALLLQNSLTFGITNNSKNGQWDNFLIQQGTNTGTIKNNAGFAIDLNGQLITRAAIDNIALTNDNNWYWIKIAHQYTSNEIGLVSVDVSGNLTGVGTEFTKVLRGSPNNPVKISFTNGVSNTQEYFVQSVTSDTSAILAGSFAAESNLTYAIVGAFTPDISVPGGSKYPYQYSSCLMTLVLETVSDTPPTLTTDIEFVVARVKRNGSTITIQDKRGLNVFRQKGDYQLNNVSSSANPMIGVESVKFNDLNSPRDQNLLYISWAFRSSNWTINTNINQVTLNGGQGGKYKSTSDFTNGDFDGWRLYAKDGSYHIIRSSSISGSQINLIIDELNADLFSDTTQQLLVTPNAEAIDLQFNANPADLDILPNQRASFPINIDVARIPLIVYKASSCTYNIQYRYRTFENYSLWTAIPSDNVHGYYNEAQFDSNGVLIGSPTRTTYTSNPTNGFITLTLAPNAYINILSQVITGDLFGIDYMALNNASPVYDFIVGAKKQQQIVTNGAPLSLTANHYFNFRTDLPATLKNGNRFVLFFNNAYTQGSFSINFTQNYVNPGSPGTVFYTFAVNDYTATANSTLMFIVVFDGTNWVVERVQSIPNVLLKLGSLDPAGDPAGPFLDSNIGTLRSKFKTGDTSDFHVGAIFDAEQTAATTHSIQGLEGIGTVSHPSGTIALVLCTIGNFFLNSSATVTSAVSVRGGGNTRIAGTIGEWILLEALMANSGGATITNGYGFKANVFPSGVVNKWNAYTFDTTGKQVWNGSTIYPPVDLGSVGTSQNDYNIGEGTNYKINATAAINITGMTNGAEGRTIKMTNLSGSFGITFPDNSGSSLAANRFAIPGGFTLAAGNTCQFEYVNSAWRLTSKTN